MLNNSIGTLFHSLKLNNGIISIVGAGGKTSTLLILAKQASEENRVIISTSTKMFVPENIPFIENSANTKKNIINELKRSNLIVCGERIAETPSKMRNPELSFTDLKEACDYLFVEADGAKGFPVKIPEEHEPVIVEGTETVISVIGLDCINRSIRDTAFRPSEIAKFLEKDVCERISIDDVYRILTNRNGLRKNVTSEMRHIIFLNKADSETELEYALKLKEKLKTNGYNDICITSYLKGGYCYDCFN